MEVIQLLDATPIMAMETASKLTALPSVCASQSTKVLVVKQVRCGLESAPFDTLTLSLNRSRPLPPSLSLSHNPLETTENVFDDYVNGWNPIGTVVIMYVDTQVVSCVVI